MTPGAGVLDRSRHDLIAGEIITLVVPSPVAGATYNWEILDKVNSTGVLSSATGTTVTIGSSGTIVAFCGFLIQLTETIGSTVTRVKRLATVRSTLSGLRPMFLGETANARDTLASHNAAQSTDNALYADRAGLGVSEQNYRGWAEGLYEMALAIDSFVTQTTPSSVGAANALGSATTLARADHVHAHGTHTATNAHQLATASQHGFMSSTYAAKLDSIQNEIVFVTVAGTSKTLALSDATTTQICTAGTAIEIRVPANASVPYPVGTLISLIADSTGQVTVVADTGAVTIESSGDEFKTAREGAEIFIKQKSANVWHVTGEKSA